MTETKPKATSRRTSPKKEVAGKAPQNEVAEKAVEEIVEAPVKIEKPTKRQFDKNDDIEIMNNTTGRYGYVGKSGFSLEMNDYGDTIDIPFGELKKMKTEQKRHIEDAFIVILDEDAVKALGLEKLYENILDMDGVEEILQDHERLDEILKKMPKTMRETIGAVATRKIRNEEINDKRIQRVIESNLNIKIDG